MDIAKSSRHRKIVGCFGENLICNWLSRSGFEVTIVDHTGMDIIAYNPSTKRRLGITVKSRTRGAGTEKASVFIFSRRRGRNDREKLLKACEAFSCEPWVGIYVEASNYADIYLTSLKNYDEKYLVRVGKVHDDWKMGEMYRKRYLNDPNVKHIRMEFQDNNWDWRE
jgi:hypothetical protein